MSQVHGCHESRRPQHAHLQFDSLGRSVRRLKLVVKVKSIKATKKWLIIWNVCAKLNINSNQRLLASQSSPPPQRLNHICGQGWYVYHAVSRHLLLKKYLKMPYLYLFRGRLIISVDFGSIITQILRKKQQSSRATKTFLWFVLRKKKCDSEINKTNKGWNPVM